MPNVTVYVVTSWANLPTKTSPLDASSLNHMETGIKNVTDFVNTLNASEGLYLCGAPFTQALLTKLNGIEAGANNYTLPTASTSILGGVKIDGTTITIENGVISSTTSGVSQLEDLTDVNLNDLEDGQILKWDDTSSKWVNTSEAEVRTQLSLLEDVDIDDTSLEDGQVLKYNGTSEKWENGEGGDVLSYEDTLDVLGLPPNPIYRKKVMTPIMTSNTTPFGEVISSTPNINRDAWYAFEQNKTLVSNDRAFVTTVSGDQYLGFNFTDIYPSGIAIKKISILNGNGDFYDSILYTFKFQGSNDGSTWTDIGNTYENSHDLNATTEFEIDNEVLYKYYRVLKLTSSGSGNYMSIVTLNMYGLVLA